MKAFSLTFIRSNFHLQHLVKQFLLRLVFFFNAFSIHLEKWQWVCRLSLRFFRVGLKLCWARSTSYVLKFIARNVCLKHLCNYYLSSGYLFVQLILLHNQNICKAHASEVGYWNGEAGITWSGRIISKTRFLLHLFSLIQGCVAGSWLASRLAHPFFSVGFSSSPCMHLFPLSGFRSRVVNAEQNITCHNISFKQQGKSPCAQSGKCW